MADDSGDLTRGEDKPDKPITFNSLVTKALIGVGGVILFIVALAFVFSGGDEPTAGGDEPTATTFLPAAQPTQPPAPEGPELAPIDICTLIDFEEAEGALGPSADNRFFSIGAGEACEWRTTSEDALLRIGPASQDLFAPGATVGGVTAVEGPEVGDAAVWFPAADGGTLGTATETEIGILLVEVSLVRPDLDDGSRLRIAADLMATAIDRIRFGRPPPIDVDLCTLISDGDAETLLAPHREGRPGAQDELFVTDDFSDAVDLSDSSVDASCKKLTTTEIYVSATTSSPEDFGPGAQFEGVTGQSVDGLGDEATLFEDVPTSASFSAPHETDIIAMKRGKARFRIVTALPDLSADEQIAVTRQLATAALARVGGDGIEVITVDHPDPDISRNGLLGNLLTREERGEWKRGEGLVESLRLIVGDATRDEVLIHPDTELEETTSIVKLANVYLDEGEDEEAKTELASLLETMFFSDDQLEAMAGAEGPTASLADFWAVAASPEDCTKFFTGYGDTPVGVGECLLKRTIPELPGYKIFGPAPGFPTGGWAEHHYNLVVQTLQETVPHLKSLGTMPEVNIVLSALPDPEAFAAANPHYGNLAERPCGVVLFSELILEAAQPKNFKQIVAHELAHCFHGETLGDQFEATAIGWWDEGMAEYWSNTVPQYANNNLEFSRVPGFDASDLSSTLFTRSYANFIFFQHLANTLGNEGVISAIRSLPGRNGGVDEQRTALGNYAGMSANYHDYVKEVTDAGVDDSGGGQIPNNPNANSQTWDQPMIIIDYPPTFGVTRLAVTVPGGKFACLSYEVSSDVELSWREGRPGTTSNSWTSGLPDALSGEAVIVATSVKPEGTLTIEVEDVADDEECEETEDDTDPGSEGGNVGLDCLDLCGISAYYKYPEALQDWVLDIMPPLSPPAEP